PADAVRGGRRHARHLSAARLICLCSARGLSTITLGPKRAAAMPSAKQHYDQVLSDVYSWMQGGFENSVERNLAFFRAHGIAPRGSGTAFDLGAGCGFQSIPLARLGFAVTAVDFDRKLLAELVENMGADAVSTVEDDLLNFDRYTEGGV